MKIDFNFKPYRCNYYIDSYKKFGEVCFSYIRKLNSFDLQTYTNEDGYISIKIIIDKNNQINYCYLSFDELKFYITEISRVLGFKIMGICNNKTCYKIILKIAPYPRYMLYVLTCVRYLYEHPYSLLLNCAIKNKHNFPDFDILHIMQFYIGIFYTDFGHNLGHCQKVFPNLPQKVIFNFLVKDFNHHPILSDINFEFDINSFKKLNTKCIPQIVNFINNIALKSYEKNKDNICCW